MKNIPMKNIPNLLYCRKRQTYRKVGAQSFRPKVLHAMAAELPIEILLRVAPVD